MCYHPIRYIGSNDTLIYAHLQQNVTSSAVLVGNAYGNVPTLFSVPAVVVPIIPLITSPKFKFVYVHLFLILNYYSSTVSTPYTVVNSVVNVTLDVTPALALYDWMNTGGTILYDFIHKCSDCGDGALDVRIGPHIFTSVNTLTWNVTFTQEGVYAISVEYNNALTNVSYVLNQTVCKKRKCET